VRRIRPDTRRVRLTTAAVIAAAAIAVFPQMAQAQGLFVPRQPDSVTVAPPGYSVTGERAMDIARGNRKVRAEAARRSPLPLVARPFLFGEHEWLVRVYRGHELRVQVDIDGRSGRVRYADAGREIGWPPLAHGQHGARAQRVHWLLALAGLLFLAPFFDRRRPFRLLHFDLLAITALGVSFGFAEAGRVYISTPLMYPPLLYLLVRALYLALGSSPAPAGRLTWAGPRLLAGGLMVLLLVRYGWAVTDGVVDDIGYASVFGADSILNGFALYDSSPGASHLDAYGPFMYLAYVPFTALFPLTDLSHDSAGAATARVLGLHDRVPAASQRALQPLGAASRTESRSRSASRHSRCCWPPGRWRFRSSGAWSASPRPAPRC
jgi:hypothetical protein